MIMKFVGYCKVLPIKNGDVVTIRKGTLVWHRGEKNPAGRTFKVKVDHILSGVTLTDGDRAYNERHGRSGSDVNPRVVWAGSGGYWSEADINDIPEVTN
jgi:hypothetical protein